MKDLDRFFSKVNKTESCWEWTAGLTTHGGYAQFTYLGKPVLGHRWIYEQLVGKISNGLQIDHLCRNRKCVNPSHLEPVSQQENIRRGLAGIENNHQRRKTKCPKGHNYSGVNNRNQRICHKCAAESSYEFRKRKKLVLL